MTVMVCGYCNRNLEVLDSETLDSKASLLFFLIHAAREDKNMMFGGHRVTEALEGARISLGYTSGQLLQLSGGAQA